MEKRKTLLVGFGKCLILMISALLIPLCMPLTAAPVSEEVKWPASLSVLTSEVGGSEHATWTAVASVLEKATGMKNRVVPMASSTQRNMLACKGDFDIATTSHHLFPRYIMGISGGELSSPKYPGRVVLPMYDFYLSLYVRGDSKVQTIYDLKKIKGLKLPDLATIPAVADRFKEGFPAFLGMTPEEAKAHFIYVPTGNVGEYHKGPLDGNWETAHVVTSSSLGYEIASHPAGIRLLELPQKDKEGWKRLMAVTYGDTLPGTCDYGFPASIGKEIFKQLKLVICSTKTDQELIYNLVKWLYDPKNYEQFKGVSPNLARMDLDLFKYYLKVNPVPMADGVIKYLKEIGLWTAADDKWNKEAAELMDKYVEAWNKASAEAQRKKIKIDANNPEWVDLFKKHKSGLPEILWRL